MSQSAAMWHPDTQLPQAACVGCSDFATPAHTGLFTPQLSTVVCQYTPAFYGRSWNTSKPSIPWKCEPKRIVFTSLMPHGSQRRFQCCLPLLRDRGLPPAEAESIPKPCGTASYGIPSYGKTSSKMKSYRMTSHRITSLGVPCVFAGANPRSLFLLEIVNLHWRRQFLSSDAATIGRGMGPFQALLTV